MKPQRILSFILTIFSMLLMLMFLSKEHDLGGGITEDGFKVFGHLVKYPTVSHFFGVKHEEANTRADSIVAEVIKSLPDSNTRRFPDFSDLDTSDIVHIVYPSDKASFIEGLHQKLNSSGCRILHYGDSQIEGDRISGYIRNRLQGIYGGGGPGFIPILQVYEHLAIRVTPVGNWSRYAAFDPTQRVQKHKEYGIYNSFSRFTPPLTGSIDSSHIANRTPVKASIEISPHKGAFERLQRYSHIKLHYGNSFFPVRFRVFSDGVSVKEGFLESDGMYHAVDLSFNATPAKIVIELEGVDSPDFYGLTIDGSGGISLDNIAMRGCSGTVFSNMNGQAFGAMGRNLSPDLVIFQYGGNTIPYVKDSTQVREHVKGLMRHLSWVKRHLSGVQVIFIGPTDMSTRIGGEMRTYPLLPYMDKLLLEANIANGNAYWSMYKAMGGSGSMPEWVKQGLAGDDYTHFSPKGTGVISELFFTALSLDLVKTKK